MSIIACGYRGVGKDTLCQRSQAGLEVIDYQEHILDDIMFKYHWVIYADDKTTTVPTFRKDITKIGSADPLKPEVHNYLNLPPGNYEKVKDTLTVMEPITRQMKVLRQHYIDYGAAKKAINICHWPIEASKSFLSTMSKEECKQFKYYISDWRFHEEKTYYSEVFNPGTTIRLFRKEIPVPDKDIISEHDLDDARTDLLLIPSIDHFESALKLHPQYAKFIPKWIVYTE